MHTLTLLILLAAPELRLTPEQAKNHIGKTATVCGTVTSARYAEKAKGQPTFLNLGKPFPRHAFTIVIWGQDRAKFDSPERSLMQRRTCVKGKITEFRGGPQISPSDRTDLYLEEVRKEVP